MMKSFYYWLRRTFGECTNRWSHSWEYFKTEPRTAQCIGCGLKKEEVFINDFHDSVGDNKGWEYIDR